MLEQLLMFLPCCFIWVAGFLSAHTSKGQAFYIFIWAYVAVIAIRFGSMEKLLLTGIIPDPFAFGSLAIEQWTVRRFIFSVMFFLPL
jgi:hypothetical protein